MQKYVLPCSCGKGQLEVDSSQSGLTLPCPECRTELTVPTLRGLRELQTAGSATHEVTSSWGAREGLLIIAVVLIIVGFGWCAGSGGFEILLMDPSDYWQYYPNEDISLQETWAYFHYLRESGLSTEPDERIQLVAMEYNKEWYAAVGKLALGCVGILLAIIALTLFRTKRRT